MTTEKDYSAQQTLEEKRELRLKYRNLYESIKQQPEAAGNNSYDDDEDNACKETDTDTLLNNIRLSNSLFANVKTSHEAVLDSRVLVVAAEMTSAKAKGLKHDSSTFDVENFVTRFSKSMLGNLDLPSQTEPSLFPAAVPSDLEISNNHESYDWTCLRPLLNKLWFVPPSIDFLYGPLTVEHKARVVKKRTVNNLSKEKGKEVRPEELKETDMKKQPNETSNNVRSISDCLVKVIAGTGRVNFFKFIINPKSFSQTVENLFYLSFLIKDGKVSFLVDDVTSEPFLSIPEEKLDEEEEEDSVSKKQIIMTLDRQVYDDSIRLYNIKESMIPLRESTANAGGKWR